MSTSYSTRKRSIHIQSPMRGWEPQWLWHRVFGSRSPVSSNNSFCKGPACSPINIIPSLARINLRAFSTSYYVHFHPNTCRSLRVEDSWTALDPSTPSASSEIRVHQKPGSEPPPACFRAARSTSGLFLRGLEGQHRSLAVRPRGRPPRDGGGEGGTARREWNKRGSSVRVGVRCDQFVQNPVSSS